MSSECWFGISGITKKSHMHLTVLCMRYSVFSPAWNLHTSKKPSKHILGNSRIPEHLQSLVAGSWSQSTPLNSWERYTVASFPAQWQASKSIPLVHHLFCMQSFGVWVSASQLDDTLCSGAWTLQLIQISFTLSGASSNLDEHKQRFLWYCSFLINVCFDNTPISFDCSNREKQPWWVCSCLALPAVRRLCTVTLPLPWPKSP